jgi:hypothetical protein
MIYVYAFVEVPGGSPPPPVPRVRGLDECPVELRTSGGKVAAACSSHEGSSIPRNAQSVWAHERVVEILMNDFNLVPARFGTVLSDGAALADVLRCDAERLSAGLDHVRGCVELGLRVVWRPADAPADRPVSGSSADNAIHEPADGSGRAYMLARLARERRSREAHHAAEQLAAEVHDDLAALARDSTRRVIVEPVPQLAASYLVPRERADIFNARVRQLAADNPQLRLLCTGPWPPYHFVPTLAPPEAAHA